jgi:lysozyme family protein
MNFLIAVGKVLQHEGGFVNHPDDPGGPTNWGVTERVAREHGYQGDMRDFPLDRAREIYRMSYWIPIHGDDLPDPLRLPVFDAAVNSGVRRAVQWLQELVGTNQDGVIGPITLAAVRKHDPERLAARYNGRRLMFLTNLEHFRAFGRGWVRRVASNMLMED